MIRSTSLSRQLERGACSVEITDDGDVQLAKMNRHTFVSLDDPLMIAGHATIAVEVFLHST